MIKYKISSQPLWTLDGFAGLGFFPIFMLTDHIGPRVAYSWTDGKPNSIITEDD